MTGPNQEPKKDENEPTPYKGEGFFDFIVHNKWDAFAYIVLFCGLLLSIFERFVGGLIVGAILGIYFSKETREMLAQFKEFLAREGIFRGFVLVAGAIALFMASPGLVIGSLFGAFIRPYLGNLPNPRG
jgi:hypothetical protein